MHWDWGSFVVGVAAGVPIVVVILLVCDALSRHSPPLVPPPPPPPRGVLTDRELHRLADEGAALIAARRRRPQ